MERGRKGREGEREGSAKERRDGRKEAQQNLSLLAIAYLLFRISPFLSLLFLQSAGVKMNREQVARQVLPTIYANAAYLAGAGATFKAGEALMETWTGKEGEAINSAFGGAVSAC